MVEGMIDITGADLKEVVRAAYDLSKPLGLGFLHYQEGGLTDEEVDEIINEDISWRAGNCVLHLDYVKGRACKMPVYKEGDRLLIWEDWYDHTDGQLKEFLARIGVE